MPDAFQIAQAKVGVSQGATEQYVTSGGVLNVSDGAIEFRNMSRGTIPFSILTARKNGTATGPGIIVSTATVPKLIHIGTASGNIMQNALSWAGGGSSGASAQALWMAPIPKDFDTSTGWTVNFQGDKTSGDEVPVLTAHVIVNGTATADRGGAASGAFTTTPTTVTFNVASGLTVVAGETISVAAEINTNASASVRLSGGWIEYKRKN